MLQPCYHHLVESRLQLREVLIRFKLFSQSHRGRLKQPSAQVLEASSVLLTRVKTFSVRSNRDG
jgi:hypothetical protein